mmetsp:Transcript_368/g.434  ORF Transcript_368/g.434 Transcript_368/m.434 type:complete len:85 (+) Transcript_368:1629-1883(+)
MGVCACHEREGDLDPECDFDLRVELIKNFVDLTRPKRKSEVLTQECNPYFINAERDQSEEFTSDETPLYCVKLPPEFLRKVTTY